MVILLGAGVGVYLATRPSPSTQHTSADQLDPSTTATQGTGTESGTGSDADTSSQSSPAAITTSSTSALPAVTTPPASTEQQPVSAIATAERHSSELKCTGETAFYDASKLIDGDDQTGWGAGEDDGAGQSITLRFSGPVHLTEVGLTPGFLKVGPRSDRGCADASAFELNRWVPEVSYRFDDGTTKSQDFADDPSMQTMAVDTTTTTVVVTIVRTARPAGADDDTILSEVSFRGWTS